MTLEQKLNALLGYKNAFTISYDPTKTQVMVKMYIGGTDYKGVGPTVSAAVDNLIETLIHIEEDNFRRACSSLTAADDKLKILKGV